MITLGELKAGEATATTTTIITTAHTTTLTVLIDRMPSNDISSRQLLHLHTTETQPDRRHLKKKPTDTHHEPVLSLSGPGSKWLFVLMVLIVILNGPVYKWLRTSVVLGLSVPGSR